MLIDAKNYFYAFVLHNLTIYYRYIKECDGSNLYVDEKNIMEKLLGNREKLERYFLPFERDINIQQILKEINELIVSKGGGNKCL